MRFKIRFLSVVGAVVLVVVLGILPSLAQDIDVTVTTSGVMWMAELGDFIPGGSSTLVRYDDAVAMSMFATDLVPGDVVTAWWVTFNHPELCSPPGCGADDLPINGGDPAVESSMMYADGKIVGDDGTALYAAVLMEDDTSGEAVYPAAGLADAQTGEVHIVLRTHGPVVDELLDEQLTSFGAACKDAPPGTGTPGDNECANIQGSGHLLNGEVWDRDDVVG